VPAAVVFDLAPIGRPDRWPGPAEGYAACDAAGVEVLEGSVGAGTGATVGKVLGPERAMKGGTGSAAVTRGDVIVGALAVVNAFGDVVDGAGRVLAGARGDSGFVDARAYLLAGGEPAQRFGHTTLVVVATNARLDRWALAEVARAAADALSWRIRPVGTAVDGDIVFAVSANPATEASSLTVELLAQDAVTAAIERAVTQARGTAAVPGMAERRR
jgi:L-aminopeptidase/D-esterase-like protein